MSTDEGVQVSEGHLDGEPAPGRRRAARRADAPADAGTTSGEAPRFWHRAHPVFTPLAGFFTGLVTIVVVLALLFWLLADVVGYDVTRHPWVFLVAIGAVFVVNLGLVAVHSTRRFARYMLFGVLATPLVIAGVAALTSYLLLSTDT